MTDFNVMSIGMITWTYKTNHEYTIEPWPINTKQWNELEYWNYQDTLTMKLYNKLVSDT
jgi:hypothetical protein